jgi:membrane-associated protease RseP (regulator of RpoE activity)
MSDIYDNSLEKPSIWKSPFFHLFLFILTFLFTTFSGAEWMSGRSFYDMSNQEIWMGVYFAIPFLGILTVHEFGHYLTAKYYNIKVSLPYYIPVWLFGIGVSIGTMGAFIQIKGAIQSRKEFFDIGYSGPWAGFFATLIVLLYGFYNLPPIEHIFTIHPDYKVYGLEYANYVYKNIPDAANIRLSSNLLFELFIALAPEPEKIPNLHEMMHYPFLFAGYLACFFTALNLLPMGQLDGGHILYGLFGQQIHKIVSTIFFFALIFFGGLGLFSAKDANDDIGYFLTYVPLYLFFLYFIIEKIVDDKMKVLISVFAIFTLQFTIKTYFPDVDGFLGWLVFGGVIGRVLGIKHPPVINDKPLDLKRKIIGWLSILIFILCFTPTPFVTP